MAPTKSAHMRLIYEPIDVYKAMLDELPVNVWLELFDQVQKKTAWAFELEQCTSFKAVE